MSVTRLKASEEKSYFIDNNTFEISTCESKYDYTNLTATDFVIGSTLLNYSIRYINNDYVTMHLSTSDGLDFDLFYYYHDNKFVKRKIFYFKPVDHIIKLNNSGYHAVVVSEFEFVQSATEDVVVFAILVFNSKGKLIGVVNKCCLLSKDFSLSYCNDAKFATLGRFVDKETMRKEIFR